MVNTTVKRRRRRRQRGQNRRKDAADDGDFWGGQRFTKKYPEGNPWGPRNKYRARYPIKGASKPFTLVDHSLEIPPIPPECNVWDLQFASQFNYGTPAPDLTEAQKNIIRMKTLKETRIFASKPPFHPIVLPARVDIIRLTNNGTVQIRIRDERNTASYANMEGRMNLWFRYVENWGIDTRIPKEELEVGLVVFAQIKEMTYIRAKVESFNDTSVEIRGVDEDSSMRLPLGKIFYFTKKLYACPFQVLECHIAGLEEWEKTTKMEVIMRRFNFLFGTGLNTAILTEFEEKDEQYSVRLTMPKDLAGKDTLNDCLMRQIKEFSYFQDIGGGPCPN